MDTNILTPRDIEYIVAMYAQWSGYKTRNAKLSARYDGKVSVKDLGISIPPPKAKQLSRCSLMWSRQAVKREADGSILEGYSFTGIEPDGFAEVMDANYIIDKYDETLPSQLQHGLSFWTVTAGDINEPPVIISSYDALHATALIDFRTNSILCGMCIVDVDPTDTERVTAFNYYAPNGDIVEFEDLDGEWSYRRLSSGVGMCCMVVMRNEPDKMHPFGKSVITPAIKSLEDEANRELVRMVMNAETTTNPTRWIMGADDSIFENGKWEAYLGNMLAIPPIDDGSEYKLPQTGQYAQGSMEPHVNYIRLLAMIFAAEASIPLHSLLYTEANPASAEAIEASRHDLIERIMKLNRLNGQTMRIIALIAISILTKTPVMELPEEYRTFSAKFKDPNMPSLASLADAACKISASVPGFNQTPTFWRMLGFNDRQIADIKSELDQYAGDANDQE